MLIALWLECFKDLFVNEHKSATSRVVVVTGGTRGIGEGVARCLANAGYEVIAASHQPDELTAFVPQTRISTALLDVTDSTSVKSLFQDHSQLAGLVNCAGILQRGGVEFEMEGFCRTIEVNLNGTMRTCLAAHEALVRGGGAIVNIASMLSYFGSPFVPAYAASKGGVAQLTKSLAAAWAKDGVRVNAIAPGWIETEMTRPLVEDQSRTASLMLRTPMNRWGTANDVSGAVEFLLSEGARFITGAILTVDGGYSAV